jgi:hypothetical protein
MLITFSANYIYILTFMNRIQYGFSLKRNDIIRVFFRFISLNFLQWNKNGTQAVRGTMKAMSTGCENLPIVGRGSGELRFLQGKKWRIYKYIIQ